VADAAVYAAALAAPGYFHAGPYYTRDLLTEVGVGEAPAPFVAGARLWVDAVRRCDRVGDHEEAAHGILCVVEFALRHDEDLILEACASPGAGVKVAVGRHFIFSEARSGPGGRVLSPPGLLLSAPLMHDRSGHAEVLAFSEVLAAADAAGLAQFNASRPEAGLSNQRRAKGVVRLYVTHHPCLSCVGALLQLRAALGLGVAIEVSYDCQPCAGRLGTSRSDAGHLSARSGATCHPFGGSALPE